MTVAGVDLGATTVRAAIADDDGTIETTVTEPTPAGSSEAVVESIVSTLESAAAEAGVAPRALDAVGIGSLGPLDTDAGTVEDPPNIDGVDRVPVVEAVRAVHDGRVVLYNDAIAGALGERFYADEAMDDLVYLTISSGIGAGAIVDGHVLEGATGNAAELGHVTLVPDSDQPCGCGGRGHWEALCSGNNIPETMRRIAERPTVETNLDLETLDAPTLFAAVGSDPLADLVVERLAQWNTLGVATAVHAYDPAHVRIGGAVATNNPANVVDPIRERLPEHVVASVPTVEVTSLGSDAVVHGAVAGALTEPGEPRS